MKIILENKMEEYAWEIMMAAHYKWEKNHGDVLRDQMDWYFNDIYKEETQELIRKEVEKRLIGDYGSEGFDVIGVSKVMYVAKGLFNHKDNPHTAPENIEQFKQELAEEYQDIREEYEQQRKWATIRLEEELNSIYYTFFNAPEELTVLVNKG
ncbi:MAG: hypothetical protein FH758_04115 [Firmicutes bacterium]|nr:hypothetical protein [Bacillota bacterium]